MCSDSLSLYLRVAPPYSAGGAVVRHDSVGYRQITSALVQLRLDFRLVVGFRMILVSDFRAFLSNRSTVSQKPWQSKEARQEYKD